MMQIRYSIRFLCMIAFAAISSAGENEVEGQRRKADEDKMVRIGEELKKQDINIQFYGIVVDQNDTPVEGASVEIQITQFSPDMNNLFGRVKPILVRTDQKGLFMVKNENGRSIYVKSIEKPGYEYILEQNTNVSFRYSESRVGDNYFPDMSSPIVFRLRMKGEAAFCFEAKYWSSYVNSKESGNPKGYDFIQQEPISDLTKPVLNGEALVCDFKLNASLNTNDGSWTVILSSGSTNGGIIVSEHLLYEAPGGGYEPEYSFVPEDRRPVKGKYIYLKSRDPAIYTRIEIEQVNANRQFFRLNGRSVTNPYGERNLEQANDVPYVVTKQLESEAKAAYRQNKRPPKPDLPTLIRQARDAAEAEEE